MSVLASRAACRCVPAPVLRSKCCRVLLLLAVLLLIAPMVQAQKIRNYYVVAAEEDGTIYHLLPQTLFESQTLGGLTYDVTYKERQQGLATINFTYRMPQMTPIDSIFFEVEGVFVMGGPVRKIYAEPGRRDWTHRYSVAIPVEKLSAFYDTQKTPQVKIQVAGQMYVYSVKQSTWKRYAPVASRILEMIRGNEIE